MAWSLLANPQVLSGIGAGIGGLFSWLGGRSTSKQHQRQLASEERRQLMMLNAMRDYYDRAFKARGAAEANRRAAIMAYAPNVGVDPQTAALLASRDPGGGLPSGGGVPAAFQSAMVPSAGMPIPQRGGFDYMQQILPFIFGPQAETVTAAQSAPGRHVRGTAGGAHLPPDRRRRTMPSSPPGGWLPPRGGLRPGMA